MGPIQQAVWGMENGSQIHKKWHALKASLSDAQLLMISGILCMVIMSCDGLMTVANCGHPMINELIRVVGYDENDLPTEQGTTINLTCPSAISITGQHSITCMENGEWEPDPTSILCQKG